MAWAAVIGYFYVSIWLWASWASGVPGFQRYFWFPAGHGTQLADVNLLKMVLFRPDPLVVIAAWGSCVD